MSQLKQTHKQLTPDPKEVRKGIQLLHDEGSVIEGRIFKANKNFLPTILSGHYDKFTPLVTDLCSLNLENGGTSVFVTLNPIKPTWQAVNNMTYNSSALVDELTKSGIDPKDSQRLKAKKSLNSGEVYHSLRTTSEEDTLHRNWVLLDIDSGQPSDCNSSDAEKTNAHLMALAISAYLIGLGFPTPSLCDSGNGWHILIRVSLQNNEASTVLVRRFLNAIAQRFDGKFGAAHVDCAVYDPNRIVKVYGSGVFKGVATEERPHRLSRVISVGDKTPAPITLLETVASEYTSPLPTRAPEGNPVGSEEQAKQFALLEKFLTYWDVEFDGAYTNDGSLVTDVACPNKAQHSTFGSPSETICTVRESGAKGFDCKHTHCVHMKWAEFAAMVEKNYKETHPNELKAPFTWGPKVTVGKKVGAVPFAQGVPGEAMSDNPVTPVEVAEEEPIAPIVTTIGDMPSECLDGTLGDICLKRMSRYPLGCSWLAIVTAAGTLIPKNAGKVISKNDGRAERTNIFVSLLGPPGTGKSACITQANTAMGVPEDVLLQATVGSGEGLMEAIPSKTDNGNVLLFPDELVNVLEKASIQNSSLATVLQKAFYEDEAAHFIKSQKIHYKGRLSLIGGIVPELFGKAFGAGSFGGLYDRFAFAHAPTGFKVKFRYPDKTVEETHPTPVLVDEEALECRDAWLDENPEASGRIIETAFRIAYICACYDGRTLQAKDLAPAFAFAKYQMEMRELLRPNAGVTFEGQVEQAMDAWMRNHANDGRWVTGGDLKDGIGAYRAKYGFRICRQALRNLGEEHYDLVIKGEYEKVRMKAAYVKRLAALKAKKDGAL